MAFWTTKDGRNIRITDMTDSHIINTINFLERKGRHIAAITPFDWDDCWHGGDAEYHFLQSVPYEDLCEEARFRKLEIHHA